MSATTSTSTSGSTATLESLVLSLYDIQAICLNGPYTLKSGVKSPFYIDLRLIVSHPTVLHAVSEAMYSLVTNTPFDVLCGVPYTALPIATLMSVSHQKPMIMRRKEGSKAYGLKKAIEGVFHAGQTCLVVEDLVTSGLSVFETIEPLEANGLKVKDIVVLINREQGGRENIESRGLHLHAVFTITQMMDILHRYGKVSREIVEQVQQFIHSSQVEIKAPALSPDSPVISKPTRLSYGDRVSHCKNAAGRTLLRIMETKKSNLCVSADVTTKAALLSLTRAVGPHICMLKTHMDILTDFDSSVPTALQALAREFNFLIFEDRKFADIGSTVAQQYSGGVYHIADWSHIVNAHAIAGPGIIKGLQQPIQSQLIEANQQSIDPTDRAYMESIDQPATVEPRGLLLIGEMSSEGALATGSYTEASVRMAEENLEFVCGFICQHALSKQPGLIHMTPGVQLPPTQTTVDPSAASAASASSSSRVGTDRLGQQYHTPDSIIRQHGSDLIIVGRAIIGASNAGEEAERYRRAGWEAYETSLKEGTTATATK